MDILSQEVPEMVGDDLDKSRVDTIRKRGGCSFFKKFILYYLICTGLMRKS